VYAHSIDAQKKYYSSVQQHFFFLENFGAIGVDLFFVISGFIIATISSGYGGLNDSLHFFLKRFLRVAPVYWIATILALLIATPNVITSGQILKTIFFLPFFDTAANVSSPLLKVGWTLSFEMYFYLLFVVLLLIKKIYRLMVLSLFIGFCIVIFYWVHPKSPQLVFILNPVFLEFLYGCLIAALFLSPYRIKNIYCWVLLGTGILFMLLNIFIDYGDVSEFWAITKGGLALRRSVIWGIPSAMIVAAMAGMHKNSPLTFPTWIIKIGDASYSIYLIHFPLRAILFWQFAKYHLPFPDILIWICVGLCILAGYGFYLLVEKPVIKKLYRLLKIKTGFI
jgi:exopolysaccharide production protein ExoZ